jgi:hypothetical protein
MVIICPSYLCSLQRWILHLRGFVRFTLQSAIISLNSIIQLIFAMVKCGVLFEVETELLNII